ncbi:MAG: RNA polymerase sigma factor [Patescibacteria group bacterium]|nr:RNA polymerase sigma factor [Patescibacteria group bacterium]
MENVQKPTDEQLVFLYLRGDEGALEVLINRYLKPIYNFTGRLAGSAKNAEDLTQETFIKAWRHLKKPALSMSNGFNPKKGSFKNWLFRIAKNTAIDFLKKKKELPFSSFDTSGGFNIIADMAADPLPLPQEMAEQKETAQKLALYIKKLPKNQQIVLLLHYNEHLTFQEIADLLKKSANTVKSRHWRALASLKKLLVNLTMPQKNIE